MTQIDHIVVSKFGVFAIETKNYRGEIYGNDNIQEWKQIIVTKVTYPKKRIVKACAFKDKIVQNSLCKNVLWPMIDKYLIADNYASRKGMGTHYAINRFRQQLHNYYLNYGNVGYCLKLDVKKYFYNINLNLLKQQMRRYDFDDSILRLVDLIRVS